MTGIYNYRIYELVDMKRVPLPLKIAGSSLVCYGVAYLMFRRNLYEEEVYKAATKYRHLYDKEYSETFLANEKQSPFSLA